MAEFNLERFKYSWKGDWTANTTYDRDDIVRVSGKAYVCVKGHVSDNIFANDLNAILPGSNPPQPDPRWIVMVASRSFKGEWTENTDYLQDDIVHYQGSLHLCIKDHTSTTFFGDNADAWGLQALGQGFENEWQSGTDYSPGTLVKYNGIVYRCARGHTSQNRLEDDVDTNLAKNKWDVFFDGIEWRSDWESGAEYRKNDLVSYGASIFRCIETHSSGGLALDDTKFVLEFPGYQHDGDFSPETYYNEGDIVRYGGYLYYALRNNFDSDPSNTDSDSSNNWIILAKTTKFVGEWLPSGRYRTGEIVSRGGTLYECIEDVSLGEGDGSSTDFLPDSEGDSSSSKWKIVNPSKEYKGSWTTGILYSVGHLVEYFGETWQCAVEHTSNSANHPENGSGYANYWTQFNTGGLKGGMSTKGDLLTRNTGPDGSTIENTRIPIGEQDQVLRAVREQEIFWDNLISDAEVIFVDPNGIDDLGRGDQYNPFKTVRYAAQHVFDTFAPLTPVQIRVATGYYQEAGPISIPAGTVVFGDELRATTIAATPAQKLYGGEDWTYTQAWLDHFISYVSPLITANTINRSVGNTTIPNQSGEISDNSTATYIADLIQTFKNRVNFLAFDGIVNPAMVGTNTQTGSTAKLVAAGILRRNKKFIADESIAYLKVTYPDLTWNEDKIRVDVHDMIRSLAYDSEFEGNHFTLLSAQRYKNFKDGAQADDLFYCRDTTGLRNCTIDGLKGTLNPPGVFDLYQRPTGGACVSLDPGWGPADERVWIKNRSPYIQGVTNIGIRCVGQKVDGALHNGGNKSITSNDFTQVLSDGIGAWITNNARAELVSVFTYYCQVGYLAENGGIIRATNGNNSYGSFGSIADGNDPTETPIPVTVNNQENEAVVRRALAGTLTDELFILEYENAGQDYTNASATITGAGVNASVEYTDFRTGALFEARLINTKGSGSEGGTNYINREANAQITADSTSTIRLTGNDLTQFDYEILGARIIIVAGQGIGQYGYIQAWNQVTKDVTVYRESDDQPGWDHIIPGYPIETSLDSTALYRIEPRLECNHPGFTSSNATFPTNRFHKDLTFGYTTATYNDIAVGLGSGETFEDLDPAAARFQVVREGPTYTVTFQGAARGAGYAVGDVLTISGTDVGGATPDNDITITVSTVTDDSTASILTFTYTGTPRGERFVAVGTPNFGYYSDDGQTWEETNLPTIGGWPKVRAGENAFVALVGDSSNQVAFSYDAESWVTRALPEEGDWTDLTYGGGYFVALASQVTAATNAVIAYSEDGLNWLSATIPDAVGDSTVAQWQKIEYGAGRFVVVSGSDRIVAYADATDLTSWTATADVLPDAEWDFAALAYGDNKFIALAKDGTNTYSVDRGETWYTGTTAPLEPGVGTVYRDLKYGNGVFVALNNNGDESTPQASANCFVTEDAQLWQTRTLNGTQIWTALCYANLNNVGTFVQLAEEATTQGVELITTGRKAKLRAEIFQGIFQVVKIWDPGSGYTDDNPLSITVTDPQFITEVETENRLANGVLSQPDFINRGSGYRSTTSTIKITGDGFADIVPEENVVTFDGATVIPGPGFQIKIEGILDLNTADPEDLKLFTGVGVEDLGDDGSGNGTNTIRVTITPSMKNEYNLAHGTAATLRLRYSQCRITGHDYLDIGTGNFEETNYPDLYAGGRYFQAAPENEVLEENGGRVFYVSTDQDGNFRTGELFSVQQATGVVTISAEFFDLDGLSELSLGGVRLGGSGAVVREFSTDPTFAEDSNNVVPTQRAIATFLADRLSVGGSDLETNDIQAGRVKVGSDDNRIETSTGQALRFPVDVDFSGQDENGNPTQVQGTLIGQLLYFRDENQSVQ